MFTHLHVHTEYSLLDGMCRVPRLIERAKELGMDSLALTDHGSMSGTIKFYLAAREAGIKPIIGCEVYVAPDSRLDKETNNSRPYHLVLLARNQDGYRNLLQLVSRANLEGFYYKPRVDRELLAGYNGGLVALSACLGGEIPRLILEENLQAARQTANWYKETFGEFYLELQRHNMPEQEKVNSALVEMSGELGIPLVATNDVHYINQEDASAHDLLLCIGTNSSIFDEKRIKMPGDFFYLKSEAEMAEMFRDVPQAIENTQRIAELCNLKLDFGRLHLPEISLPEGKTPFEYLSDLCYAGLDKFYPDASPEIRDRLAYELEVIKETQFANYFLVVWDIISFTRQAGIMFGVRGSAAASIVLRCLGITEVDPIEHKLVFERFLNIERKEMPDIDMDFEDGRREEVIEYVTRKYGQDHVAQIITFGTLGARAALRDVGRALGMPYSDVDRVTRLVPFSPNMTLDKALEENGELRGVYEQNASVHNLVDSARRIEGVSRHASTHAAGVVISKEPLTKYVPLQRPSRGNGDETAMTQFSMEDIARIGLLKMDFLGLANLTILGKAKELIKENRGEDIDLLRLPMDDARTFELLAAGETIGVFQLEGAGMRRYIKELKPTCFSDITAMIALYRPGPMEHIPTFIRAKYGLEPIRYPHEALASILEETYGVIVYQEQVLFIVQALAGYSLGQADIFRKAMGKKIAGTMKKEKKRFMDGAKEKGFSDETAEAVFALIEPFAGYAFNKAHATSYALIAYQTAWLKANYPAEYITAFLTAHAGEHEKTQNAVAECRRLGIKVLPPDINLSRVSFSIEKDERGEPSIRFGLDAIKNVGTGAIEPLIEERDSNGKYESVEDLCRRADLHGVNRRVMESLVKAGALDRLGERGTLLAGIGDILSLAQREQRLRDTGQATMFDLWGTTVPVPMPELEMTEASVSSRERLAWEKELMGVYLSEHPFSAYAGSIDTDNDTLCGQVDAEMDGLTVKVAGMVASVRYLTTREGKPFASLTLEDLDGSLEVNVWPKVFATTQDLWQEGNILLVEGKVRIKEDRVQLSCEYADHYRAAVPPVEKNGAAPSKTTPPTESAAPGRRLSIHIIQTEDESGDMARLEKVFDVLADHPGDDEVSLSITNGDKIYHLKLNQTRVDARRRLQEKLAELVGEAGIRVESR